MDKELKKNKNLQVDPVGPCCDDDNSSSEYKVLIFIKASFYFAQLI